MQAIKETATDLLRNHPHLCCLVGFSAVVAYGVVKLLALMPATPA